MASALDDVQATFLSLDSQYNMLLAACQTEAQRNALKAQYSTAQQNYQATLNAELAANDQQIAELRSELQTANTQVVKATEQMGNISKAIDEITTAVNLGTKIVALI